MLVCASVVHTCIPTYLLDGWCFKASPSSFFLKLERVAGFGHAFIYLDGVFKLGQKTVFGWGWGLGDILCLGVGLFRDTFYVMDDN